MPTILEAQNLVKELPMGREKLSILRGVNLKVEQGEVVAIVGPSGCGKTTLLGLIGGLDTATSGSITVAGQELSRLSEDKLADVRNRTIGFVFQFFNLVPTLTALENVALPVQFDDKSRFQPEKRAAELLTLVGLGHRLKHKPKELSGGEQQRVAIARALANQPAILLGDEPTGNLDSERGQEILELIFKLRDELGLTVILVTHDPKVAARADRVLHMKDGQFIETSVMQS
ncbi:MAG: ABC transporter ATP-binding protein [Chloroflexi bacterium]|uniref:ABC transporter ATP-binding protein n=1 Tax=Candidatus Chlorohelix allophototropha TaxID=3003348 RepID=A0A8T7LX48_9CHLR|nr:ABC transporter ATP-binding protein [Chloroflexota bacterium]WJW66655.1 ABC transporter ATP-binding protein [Chloroflexota bacterium L227-S17]